MALFTSSSAIGALTTLPTAVAEAIDDRADLPWPSNVEVTSLVPTVFTTSFLPNDIAKIVAFPPSSTSEYSIPTNKVW